jgi:hypothetical protein
MDNTQNITNIIRQGSVLTYNKHRVWKFYYFIRKYTPESDKTFSKYVT